MATDDEIGNLIKRADLLRQQAAKVFQPRTPITTKELFAGRWTQLTEVSDAVNQPGLHAVIFGERGVGKSSLANVIHPTIYVLDNEEGRQSERLVVKAVANTGDTFSKIWHRLFVDLRWPDRFDEDKLASTREAFSLGDELSVDDVRRVVSATNGAVFIVDEFDQASRDVSKAFTELIKALSDLCVDTTIVLVGVSDTVSHLIADHGSIDRAITQVPLKRMKPEELRQIIQKAETALQITFDEDAAKLVCHMSQGLPHYTHLIGLHAVRAAADKFSVDHVRREHVFEALRKAITQAEHTVTTLHSTAIHSSQKTALYRQVLFACALAAARSHDPLGYFSPSGVTEPLGRVLGKEVEIATFNNHLREFCEDKRGTVLERDGQPWGFRYRFRNPLLVPYVFMDGMEKGLATDQGLLDLLTSNDDFSLS